MKAHDIVGKLSRYSIDLVVSKIALVNKDTTRARAQPGPLPKAQPVPLPKAQPAPLPKAQPAPLPKAQPVPPPVAQSATVFRPQHQDTLFWCLYTLMHDEHRCAMAEQSPFSERASCMIDFVTLVRENKAILKAAKIRVSQVEEGLSEEIMSPQTFVAIATLKSLPVVLLHRNVYYKVGASSANDPWNVVRLSAGRDSWVMENDVGDDRVNELVTKRFRSDGSGKLLKAMTGYSKPELEELSSALGLNVVGMKGGVQKPLTKPELYKSLYTYVSL